LLLDWVLLARLLAAGLDTMVTFLARVLLDTVVGGQALALAVHTLGSMRTVGTGGRRGDTVAILVEGAFSEIARSLQSIGTAASTSSVAEIAFACSLSIRVTGAKARGVKSAPLGRARIGDILVTNTVAILVEAACSGRARKHFSLGTGTSTSSLTESALTRSLGIRVTGAKARGVKSAPLGLARISNILVTNTSASIADFAFFASTHSANRDVTFTTITVTTTTDSFQPAMGSSWAGIISVWTRQRRSLESVAVAASMCCIAPLGAGGGG